MTIPKMYDLAVIGAGPGGIVGATTAASLGASVVLVDRYGDLGGAGANTGTVPSKTLRETALALSGIHSRDLYSVDLSLRREATVSDLMHREQAVREALNRMLAQLVETSWEHASELVHIGLIAMTTDCDASVFSKLCFNVPTLGALYQDATWRLINERARMTSAAGEWSLA